MEGQSLAIGNLAMLGEQTLRLCGREYHGRKLRSEGMELVDSIHDGWGGGF